MTGYIGVSSVSQKVSYKDTCWLPSHSNTGVPRRFQELVCRHVELNRGLLG